jgi:hypothetical protein
MTTDKPIDPATMPDEIATELEALERGPFRRLLTHLLDAEPPADALKAAAAKNPSFWVQSVAIAAKLAGFPDRLDVNATAPGLLGFVRQIQQLSDAELQQRIASYKPAASAPDGQNGRVATPRARTRPAAAR